MRKTGQCLLAVITLLAAISPLFLFSTPVRAESRVDHLLNDMTTEQKVTQLLMPDFRSWQGNDGEEDFTTMNEEVETVMNEYDFGGVILFAENVQETEQTARLTYDLQEAALKNNEGNGHSIPLLLTIDQEGGSVYRLGTGTALPGNMALGATRSPEHAKTVGEIIGRELSSLGINTNLAPVMDVNNNPNNPVIGLRSFSSHPELVSELGVAMNEGFNEYNVSGAAKHFPGHGDTDTDSHLGLPEVDKSLEELRSTELLPFQKAIDEGVDMIMTAHMMFPQLDSEHPATLSQDILTGLLREDMGYDGIIITDAMNMEAITEEYGEIDATKQAIYAGVDIVLMPTTLRSPEDVENKLDPMIEELVTEAETEAEFMNRLDESVKRVLQLKEDRGILDDEENKISEEEQVNNALNEVGSDYNRQLEREISRDAVTVVKNEDRILPFNPKNGDDILLVGAEESQLPSMEFSIDRLMEEGVIPSGANYESVLLRDDNEEPWSREEIQNMVEGKDHVVVLSDIENEEELDPAESWSTRMPKLFIEEAEQLDVDATVMSTSNPYDVANYPNAKGIVAVYGNQGTDDPTESTVQNQAFGPNIPAGLEIIFGKEPASGTLPVDIPGIDDNYTMTGDIEYSYGYGLTLNEEDKK